MRYVAFVGTEGRTPAAAIEEMNRGWPAYAAELERRDGLRLGRELSLPETGVSTVRVRDGETLVTDGPFIETKEYVGGFDLFDAADLDDAIGLESRSPVARFLPFEIRPVAEDFRIGPTVTAFADGDDSEGVPYLLIVWVDGPAAALEAEPALARECETWRTELERSGAFVLGGAIGAPDTATTLRMPGGRLQVTPGPFLATREFIAGIEVVRAPGRAHATDLAARHPHAREHSIEVRAFYTEQAPA